ncbi:MAG TPA: hypothetical protein VJ890_01950 [Vineibacter sp.]|nr:hypothetical protein [Vineibacter sp.]
MRALSAPATILLALVIVPPATVAQCLDGTYGGTISGGMARLTGVQNWTLARGAPDPGGGRECDIEAKATR